MRRHRSLVPIRHYETQEELFADIAVLEARQIRADAGGLLTPEAGWTLSVDTTDVVRALDALNVTAGPELAEFVEPAEPCPRCQSTRGSAALPPYLLIGLAVAFAASLALAQLQLWYWLAGFAAVAGIVIRRLERAHHWRCLNCHFTWNRWAEEERRAEARRAAPE